MPKSATLDNQLLKLIYQAVGIANLADNAAGSPLTTLYVALHTADPTGGDQTTSEANYGGYTRIAVARSSAGWIVTGNSVSPAGQINFPLGTSGSGIATFASVGFNASGASEMLHYGAISPTISMGSGVSPFLSTSSTIQES